MIIYYAILVTVIIICCYIEYADKRDDAKAAVELKQTFEEWYKSKTKSPRPSNAVFAELYKKRYKSETSPKTVFRGNSAIIIRNQVDVVGSFPSTNSLVIQEEFMLLDNMTDYYVLQFEKIKSIKYFIKFIVSIPLQFLKYIGIDNEKQYSKLIQILFWILSLFVPVLQELFTRFFSTFLKFK